jgi:hypothetical protein
MAVITPQALVEYAVQSIKSQRLDTAYRYRVADQVAGELWTAAPWRWTLEALAPITITGSVQDTAFTKPADFLYLHSATLFDADEKPIDLTPVPYLQAVPAGYNGIPKAVAYVVATGDKIRFGGIPPAGVFEGLYKKTYTPVTSSNYATVGAMGVPDEWAWVAQLGVLFYAYKYADDPRAGSAQVQGGTITYNGCLGDYKAAVEEMRRAEKMPLEYPGIPKVRG